MNISIDMNLFWGSTTLKDKIVRTSKVDPTVIIETGLLWNLISVLPRTISE